MRTLLIAALAAGLALPALIEGAAAQPRAPTSQRANPFMQAPGPPDIRFRTRTADERLAVARRLATRTQPDARLPTTPTRAIQLGESFTLTPRNPYSANRGAMSGWQVALFEPDFQNSGHLFFSGGSGTHAGALALSLTVAAPSRLLVECTAWSSNTAPFTASASLAGAPTSFWTDPAIAQNGVISYLTPVIPSAPGNTVYIRIKPGANPNGVEPNWGVMGCEVTRIAA